MQMKKIKVWLNLVKMAGIEFVDDNATKLSASLAYYTIFAIGPLLLLTLSIAGLFFESEDISLKVQFQLQSLLGKDGAAAVLTILQNLQETGEASKFGLISLLLLVFSASGVFAEIQGSINFIWSLRAKPKRSWLKYLTDRLLSISLVGGLGFLLVVTLLVNTITDMLTGRLMAKSRAPSSTL